MNNLRISYSPTLNSIWDEVKYLTVINVIKYTNLEPLEQDFDISL